MAVDCFNEIRKVISNDVSDTDLRAIIDEVENRKNAANTKELDKSFDELADEFLEQKRVENALARKEFLENRLKRKQNLEFINQEAFKNDPVEGLHAIFRSTSLNAKGATKSIENRISSIRNKHMMIMSKALSDNGNVKILRDGTLDREIMDTMYRLGKGLDIKKGTPQKAIDIAKTFNKIQKSLLNVLQESGFSVRNLDGYVVRQVHDATKIRQAGLEQWTNKIIEGVQKGQVEIRPGGKKLTDTDEIAEFLSKTYDDILSKDFEFDIGFSSKKVEVFSSGTAANKRVSRSRSILMDGEFLYEYNKTFGQKNLLGSIMKNIDKTAREVSIAERLGTAPQETLNILKRDIALRTGEKDFRRSPVGVPKALGLTPDQLFAEVSGLTQRMGQGFWARTGRNLRSLNVLSKLGNVLNAAIADPGAGSAVLASKLGSNYLKNMGNFFTEIVKNQSKGQRKAFLESFEIFIDDFLGDAASRFDATRAEFDSGAMSRLTSATFKLFGLEFWDQSSRNALVGVVARDLTNSKKLAWANLRPEQRNALFRAGIEQADWKVLKKATKKLGKHEFINPTSIAELSDDLVDKAISEKGLKISRKKYKDDLEFAFSSYIEDIVNDAVPRPGVFERAMINRGVGDEGIGSTLRTMFQFTSHPLSILRVLEKIKKANPDNQFASYQHLSSAMIGMTVLGYAGLSIKNLSLGLTPPDPTDPATWRDAFVRGGAGAIQFDYLLGEYEKNYRSMATDILGPTFGQVDSVGDILAKTRQAVSNSLFEPEKSSTKDYQKIGKSLFYLFKRNTPFQNHFLVKPVTDMIFMDALQESMSPGYASRKAERVEKQGLSYIFNDPRENIE